MASTVHEGAHAERRRRQLKAAIRESLRGLGIEMSLLSHHVAARIDLNDVDLEFLNLIARHGPLSPGGLARRSGLHPATTTGILDRLERGGWIDRERDPSDRRAVLVRFKRDRSAELSRLFAGMNASVREICARYENAELEHIADFLERITDASRHAAEKLAGT